MIDLSPASQEVVRKAFESGVSTHLTDVEIRAIAEIILPELEKDTEAGFDFVEKLITNHNHKLLNQDCFSRSNLLNNLIMEELEGFSYNVIQKIIGLGGHFNLNSKAVARLAEYSLTRAASFPTASTCYLAHEIKTGDDDYDKDLTNRIIKRLKENAKNLNDSNMRKTLIAFYEKRTYTHDRFNFYKICFEPSLFASITMTGQPQFPQISPILNKEFHDWVITYMNDFYYTEIMVNNEAFSRNPILTEILAHNPALVSEEVSNHAKEQLLKQTRNFLSPYFMRSMIQGNWIEDTEVFHIRHFSQQNNLIQDFLHKELGKDPFENWMVKKEGALDFPITSRWKNVTPVIRNLLISKGYREYLSSSQAEQIKKEIFEYISSRYDLEIENIYSSLELLSTILETSLISEADSGKELYTTERGVNNG